MVWRLGWLARSLRHLIDIVDDLNRRGIALKSMTESIDTTTPTGAHAQHPRRTEFHGTRDHRRAHPCGADCCCCPWSSWRSACGNGRIQNQGSEGYAGVWQHVGNRSGTAAWMRAQHPCVAICRVVAPPSRRSHDAKRCRSVCIPDPVGVSPFSWDENTYGPVNSSHTTNPSRC